MRYVILRDDDTSALTPVECLERLYSPFLASGLPVNLAVIPNVRTDTTGTDGRLEGYIWATHKLASVPRALPITSNEPLVRHVRDNTGYHIAQHGYDHSMQEFASRSPEDIGNRLKYGARLLMEAGFPRPETFVAPYDTFSRVSLRKVATHFRVISTDAVEWRNLPLSWWPKYAMQKISHRPHWRIGKAILLTHPGWLLCGQRPAAPILDQVKKSVGSRRLTVLVNRWWEYFREQKPNESFISMLHETAAWLASQPEVKVISFAHLSDGQVPLH